MISAPYPLSGHNDMFPHDIDVPHIGMVSRDASAARMAVEGMRDGDYTVRVSQKLGKHGAEYGLAVAFADTVTHYKITKHKSKTLSTKGPNGRKRYKFGIQEGFRYEFIAELIEHYHDEADGLCCALKRNISYKLGVSELALF